MENEGSGGDRAGRFAAYLADLASVLGDARRYAAMVSYCTGLLLPSERKSVEPMAAVTAPTRTAAQHQSLLHFVGQGDWSDAAVRSASVMPFLPCVHQQNPWYTATAIFVHSVFNFREVLTFSVQLYMSALPRIARVPHTSKVPDSCPYCGGRNHTGGPHARGHCGSPAKENWPTRIPFNHLIMAQRVSAPLHIPAPPR